MLHEYSVQMTPGEAAEILDIARDSPPETIHRAFRAHARVSHPDLFQTADPGTLAAAQAEFVRITAARDILLSEHAAPQKPAAGGGSRPSTPETPVDPGRPADSEPQVDDSWRAQRVFIPPYAREVPRPPNAWAFAGWVALLAVAIGVSYFGGPFPQNTADLWVRLIPYGLSAALFGATGRTPYLVVAAALAAVTAALTFWLASFGSLLSLEVLLVPSMATWIIGRRRMLRRAVTGTARR
jgi:hypothetical protein